VARWRRGEIVRWRDGEIAGLIARHIMQNIEKRGKNIASNDMEKGRKDK
jgi:hypothetical protein